MKHISKFLHSPEYYSNNPENIERDCMKCEQTFTTTNRANDDYCLDCRIAQDKYQQIIFKLTQTKNG